MARTILFLVAGAALAVACSEDSDDTGQAGTQSTNQSSSTSAQGGGSTGGQGSGAQGAQGGNGTGGVGGCASCNDYLSDPASIAIMDVCGVEMYDPATGDLTCAPGSSCELLGALFECACGTGCPDADECGPSWCMLMPPNQACTTCLGRACTEVNDACIAD